MDPKRPGMLLAPPPNGSSGALRLPASRETFPLPDEHLVRPEVTGDEVIRGRRVVAMPALPAHADRQFGLGYVIGAYVKPGFVGSAELLTRAAEGSDFATDVCVRAQGTNPETGTRHLEELAFEVVNEQSLRDVTEKAEELTRRGVRKVIAIFVKKGEVCEWKSGRWQKLDPEAMFSDATLARPLRVRELIDAAEADNAVARALLAKKNPVLMQLRAEGLEVAREAVRTLCRVLSIAVGSEREAILERLDAEGLQALCARIERDRAWL